MPGLLTIPRELRDRIYDWTLSDTLASFQSRVLQRERKTIEYTPSEPETLFGDNSVQFPAHTSLPPAHGLLHTTRQIRYEFLDSIRRLGAVRYEVDLVDRKDRGTLAPTWVSVPCLPCFTDRIDVLSVNWRARNSRTSSIATSVGDSQYYASNAFHGSLALLQRFIERGVYLLSKKKRAKLHIGLLEIHINLSGTELDNEEEIQRFAEEACAYVDEYLLGVYNLIDYVEDRQTMNEQFEMLVSKIDRVQIHANGALHREWDLSQAIARREEHSRNADVREEESEEDGNMAI
jgi:hypothetical protein